MPLNKMINENYNNKLIDFNKRNEMLRKVKSIKKMSNSSKINITKHSVIVRP